VYKIIGGDGREYGPVTVDQIRDWVRQGRANAQTLVLPEGGTDWVPLAMCAELVGGQLPTATEPVPLSGAPRIPAMLVQPLSHRPQTNPMAVTALVMGLLSICCCGPLFGILGAIFAFIAFSQLKRNPAGQTGKGMAVAGLACSIAGIVLGLAMVAIWIAMVIAEIAAQ
jgi:hypothetical protein